MVGEERLDVFFFFSLLSIFFIPVCCYKDLSSHAHCIFTRAHIHVPTLIRNTLTLALSFATLH